MVLKMVNMISCPVCCSFDSRLFLKKNGYDIKICSDCQTLYVSPRPTLADLTSFYNRQDYYQSSDLGYLCYLGEEKQRRIEAQKRLRIINSLLPIKGKLLDLGCAAGFFLDEAHNSGWFVVGTELSNDMRQFAFHKLGVHVFSDTNIFKSYSFDVVTMWEYIEHLVDPLNELQSIRNLLKTNGVICISTPNTAHLQLDQNPQAWWEFKPPAHLTFFTAKTLQQLVETAGYEILQINFHTPMLPVSGARWCVFLQKLRALVGDRLDKATPLWWVYSITRHLILKLLCITIPSDKICVGIDLYARKKGFWT